MRNKKGQFVNGTVPKVHYKKGNIPWNLGKKHSEETKKKCGEKNKKQWVKKECKKCGKKFEVSPCYTKRINCCSKSCATSLRLSGKKNPKLTGDKHPNWKGGITPINHAIRTSLEYKLWRKAVFERDNHTCIWCGAKSGKGKKVVLNADHIKPFYLFPELRFAIDNGRTLCEECHKTTDTWGRQKK